VGAVHVCAVHLRPAARHRRRAAFPAHTTPQIHVDAKLFGNPVPTVWLQHHLWHGAAHIEWWDYAVWFVYLTHFFATLFVAGALWLWWHDRFARFATMVCALR
jgi:hypothetical protein